MSTPDIAQYLKEAASWDADRIGLAQRAALRARVLAIFASVLAAMAIGALIVLMPLKSVTPYLIRVDNTSGSIDVVPTYEGGAPLSDTVTRYLLTHYITTCERFTFATAEQDYSECGAFHTPQRNQQWATRWARANPQSPLNLYKDGSTLRVEVQAVSFFERGTGVKDLAQVRYTQTRREPSGSDESVTHWIATLQYAYVKPSEDPATRRWNPLGFRIVEFRPEPELTSAASQKLSTTNDGPSSAAGLSRTATTRPFP